MLLEMFRNSIGAQLRVLQKWLAHERLKAEKAEAEKWAKKRAVEKRWRALAAAVANWAKGRVRAISAAL